MNPILLDNILEIISPRIDIGVCRYHPPPQKGNETPIQTHKSFRENYEIMTNIGSWDITTKKECTNNF